jgi:hypothetical protein
LAPSRPRLASSSGFPLLLLPSPNDWR